MNKFYIDMNSSENIDLGKYYDWTKVGIALIEKMEIQVTYAD